MQGLFSPLATLYKGIAQIPSNHHFPAILRENRPRHSPYNASCQPFRYPDNPLFALPQPFCQHRPLTSTIGYNRLVATSVIDSLPETERSKIVSDLLSGASQTAVARKLGVSRQAVSQYTRRVLRPAMQSAAKLQSLQGLSSDPSQLTAENKLLVRQAVSSPFMERHSYVWDVVQESLERGRRAVQVTKDGDAVGEDLAVLAPLLNQAHKSLELLGKATGELQDKSAAPVVSIQIVVPANPSAAPRVEFGTGEGVIDVGFEDIGARL